MGQSLLLIKLTSHFNIITANMTPHKHNSGFTMITVTRIPYKQTSRYITNTVKGHL